MEYQPFGEMTRTAHGSSGALENNAHLFTAHEREFLGSAEDPLEGMDYMHARYYSAGLGRFFSVDPAGGQVGDSQAWNRYSYVRNNPLGANDPDGEFINLVTAASGAAIGAAVGFVGSVGIQYFTEGTVNWRDAGAAAAGGAVSGGIAGATMGLSLVAEAGLGGAMAAGAVGNVAGGMVQRSLDSSADTHAVNGLDMIVDGTLGAIGGGAGHVAEQGVRTAESATVMAAEEQLQRAESSLAKPSRTQLAKRSAFRRAQAAAGKISRVDTKATATGTVTGAQVTNATGPAMLRHLTVESHDNHSPVLGIQMVASH